VCFHPLLLSFEKKKNQYLLKAFQWNQEHSRRCHGFENLNLIKEKNQTTLLQNIKDNYKQHLKTQ